MTGIQLEHVVEEPDPRRDLRLAPPVEDKAQADVGLTRRADNLRAIRN